MAQPNSNSPIEWLNPLKHMNAEDYSAFWHHLFATFLHGFWSRLIFFALIFLAFWFGVRHRNPAFAAILLLLAAFVAYGGGIVGLVSSSPW